MNSNSHRFGITDELIKEFHKTFAKHPAIDQVIIYGSRARGDHKPYSDIDLTLEGDQLDHLELMAIAGELDDINHPYLIDLSRKSSLTSDALLHQIQKNGKPFYHKNHGK
jgi:predicted nucleotidyltransferase